MKLPKWRDRFLPLLAVLFSGLLLIGLILVPPEAHLGHLIKLVFVHGALVWVGLLSLSLAGLLGLVALIVRRPPWYRGTQAAGLAALIIWVVYVLSAMLVTKLTWGQWIAWNEPRVRTTALILAAVVVVWGVGRLVAQADFTAVLNLLMGVVPWIAVRRAGVIRHPVDPIGSSPSAMMQLSFLLIMLTVGGLAAVLIAWLWINAEIKHRGDVRGEDER